MAQNQQQGRPSGYRAEAAQLAESGMTQIEIAALLGCTNRTLSRWALKYPAFRAALDRGLGRRAADRRRAETAPLRAAAAELWRMIADAHSGAGACEAPLEDNGGDACTPAEVFASTKLRSSGQGLARRRRERLSARYSPLDAEPDPFDGEPVEMLDPRSEW